MDSFTTFISLFSSSKSEDSIHDTSIPTDEETNGGYGNNAYCVIA
ncbi:pheromone-like peptide [Agaricus bisporus var. bisporus H97]|nr:pheromone-like peptide [Agaricus bisporus var. bisporus H97]EKV52036.1 pheromone-like peptide [Agaricus bisporus var. bisporus H97]